MKNIIVLSQPRTGSNLLCEVFFSFFPLRVLMEFFIYFQDLKDVPHHKVLRPNELDALAKHFKLQDSNIESLTTTLNQHPKEALDAISSIIPQYKVIKLHDFMLEQMDLEFIFNDPETKFVVLERTSKLKQYVSLVNARALGRWTDVDTSDMKVHVDTEDFLKFKNSSNNWYQMIESKLANQGHNYLKLTYEQDLENIDWDVLIPKINKWLDNNNVRYLNTTNYKIKNSVKQNNSSLKDTIINYDEIKDLLS
jgi:LPS sulfotransferase NodH